MGPCFVLPLAALACCLLPAGCCVICDPEVQVALKSLETDFLPNFLNHDDAKYVYDSIVRSVKEYPNIQFNDRAFKGILDETTTEVVTQSFLTKLRNITWSNVKEINSLQKLKTMLRTEKENFAFHAAQFQTKGLMFQSMVWCQYCSKYIQPCRKSRNCGAHHVNVREMEEMNLNCHLGWHDYAYGITDYVFTRIWKNKTETVVRKGKDPVMNMPSVALKDAGTYRCILGTIYTEPSTVMLFHVTVVPRKSENRKPSEDIQNQPDTEEEAEEEFSAPTSLQLEHYTILLHSLDVPSSLQERVHGLVICFVFILLSALVVWLFGRRKSKGKQKSSQVSTDSKTAKPPQKKPSQVQKK